MNRIKQVAICCCLVFLFGCSSDIGRPKLTAGRVSRVVSGQGIEVVLEGTSTVTKVRIIGIDAPDLRQSPWGTTAKARLTELVEGKSISLEIPSPQGDRFNRVYAHLWQDRNLISEQLVKEGYVLANIKYPHSYSKLLAHAQEYARLMGYGIWNPQLALRQIPKQFRSQTR